MTTRYTFAQTRKTWAAAGGLVATIIAYVLADTTIRDVLPPNVAAVLGMLGTLLAVFRTPNERGAPTVDSAAADVERATQATQVVRDHVTAMTQVAQQLETALGNAITTVPGVGPLAQQAIDVVARR